GVDERADLYALGVLCYRLLGGEPPVPATDPARWSDSHLRVAPRPLTELVDGLPPSLGEIIAMLLAKSPNDRYQTARGLVVDLEHCHHALAAGTAATPLLLRMRDVSRRLVVSGRVYGRDRQLSRLRAVYDRIAAGGPAELVTVTADTGFGKWTTVAGFADTMATAGALTLRATCGRDENIPYAAITRLFTDLARQLAGTPTEHRMRIADAVGACGATLVELVPQLSAVLGDLPPSPAGPVTSARNRIRLAARRLLGAVGTPEHPPIIAIGNIGWADRPSVDLLRYVLGGRNAPSVLAVVTYRAGDVNAEQPCHALVTDGRLRIASMQLRPLPDSAVADLLADALGSGKTDSSKLSRTIAARTRSNPLLVGHLLHDLADRDVITYRAEGATWGWHERLVDSEPDVTGIAALVGSRLGRFPARTRELLEIAAVLGPRFDAGTLAAAANHARQTNRATADGGRVPRSRGAARSDAVAAVTTALQPAAHAELLTVDAVPGEYRWRHEELRQAVLTCAGSDNLDRLRLAAGRALQRHPERLFEAAAQLNAVIELLPATEGHALAELNLAAGRRAGRLGAAAAAREYFALGLDLLGVDPWQLRPDLALRLHLASADAEHDAGQVERAERLLARAADRVTDDLDRARVLGLQGTLRYEHGDRTGALRTAMEALRLLGQPVPTDPARWQAAAAAEVARLRPRLDTAGLDRIAVAPECTDFRVVAAADLIAALLRSPRPAQLPARAGADLLAATGVAMAVAEGPTAATGLILTRLAEALSATGDEATAHRCARAGVRLLSLPDARHPAATRVAAAMVGPLWLESPELMTRELDTAHRYAAEEGEVALAQRIGILYTVHRFAIGVPLDEVAADLDARWRYAGRHGMDEPTAAVTRLLDDVVSRLRGLPPVEPDQSLIPAAAEPDRFAAVGLMPMLIAAHLLGEAGQPVVRLDLADLTDGPAPTDFLTAEITFLRALALTSRYETATPADRPVLRAALRTLE
ncbi:MAG: hypothetical protein QOI74_1551, partial [Micromonosporaceae bacterium]|nr:hypothetical protein [Micromonosporaceae bacterium]